MDHHDFEAHATLDAPGAGLRESTLCFLLRGHPACQVLLGFKKVGFGAGKYDGFGGKLDPGEMAPAAAVRELEEESGVRVAEQDLDYVACLDFLFPHRPVWDQRVHAYLATRWVGEPRESAEMAPAWFSVDEIPYGQMWQDGPHWLSRVLAGERVRARFVFAADNETVEAVTFEPFSPSPGSSP